MLQEGKIAVIGFDKYRVTRVPKGVLGCMGMCDIKDCGRNQEFQDFKRKRMAQGCMDIIGIGHCFKRVKDE